MGTLASLLESECGSPNEAPVALLGFADDSLPRCCTADFPMNTRVCEPQLTQDKRKCDEMRPTVVFSSEMKRQEISNKNKVVIRSSGRRLAVRGRKLLFGVLLFIDLLWHGAQCEGSM